MDRSRPPNSSVSCLLQFLINLFLISLQNGRTVHIVFHSWNIRECLSALFYQKKIQYNNYSVMPDSWCSRDFCKIKIEFFLPFTWPYWGMPSMEQGNTCVSLFSKWDFCTLVLFHLVNVVGISYYGNPHFAPATMAYRINEFVISIYVTK